MRWEKTTSSRFERSKVASQLFPPPLRNSCKASYTVLQPRRTTSHSPLLPPFPSSRLLPLITMAPSSSSTSPAALATLAIHRDAYLSGPEVSPNIRFVLPASFPLDNRLTTLPEQPLHHLPSSFSGCYRSQPRQIRQQRDVRPLSAVARCLLPVRTSLFRSEPSSDPLLPAQSHSADTHPRRKGPLLHPRRLHPRRPLRARRRLLHPPPRSPGRDRRHDRARLPRLPSDF